MNLTSANKSFLYANFNQDFTAFSIGTRSGFQLFSCEPLGKTFNNTDGGIGIVEMLFSSSSIVALVGGGEKPAFSKSMVKLMNTKRGSVLTEIKCSTPITAVRLNRRRMIVVQEKSFGVYDMSNLKLMETFEIPVNKQGICALSPNNDRSYFAYPGSKEGSVTVLDVLSNTKLVDLEAHFGSIQMMAFNSTGTLLATASDKGTLIRVFSIPDGKQLFQFRRGSYPATIFSLSFNPDSSMLAVSSDSETIHLFKLASPAQTSYAWSMMDAYLPTVIHNMVDPARNFAHIKLPTVGEPNISGFISTDKILVVTSEGTVLLFHLDPVKGGLCTFVSGHSLNDM